MFLESLKIFWKIDDEDHEDLHHVHVCCILPAKFHTTFIPFPADLAACSSVLLADYGLCMRLGFEPKRPCLALARLTFKLCLASNPGSSKFKMLHDLFVLSPFIHMLCFHLFF